MIRSRREFTDFAWYQKTYTPEQWKVIKAKRQEEEAAKAATAAT